MIEQLLPISVFVIAYIFTQALFINGVKASASGSTEVMPNGIDYDGEMILYPLKKFLTQSKIIKVYYSGEEFKKLLKKITQLYPTERFDNTGRDRYLIYTKDSNGILLWNSIHKDITNRIDAQIKIEFDHANNRVYFYKEYEKYRFSKYVRKPIIQCIICMGSFWTIPTYWIPAFCWFGLDSYVVLFGIINTFCVSYANYLIYKKV